MEIIKVINNNVISSIDENGNETILIGTDIGAGRKSGMEVDNEKIEKTFILDNPDFKRRFMQLLENIPLKNIILTADIVEYAKNYLNIDLNKNVYATLADHITFAIDRKEQGVSLKNAIIKEIQRYYQKEFLIGQYAVKYIKEQTGIDFNDDEAGFIALHFVNAEFEKSGSNLALGMTDLIKNSLDIIEKELDLQIESNTLCYDRMVTHLKFLAQRIYNDDRFDDGQGLMAEMMRTKHPEIYRTSEKIKDYVKDRFDIEISEAECVYLTIHISRVIDQLNRDRNQA